MCRWALTFNVGVFLFISFYQVKGITAEQLWEHNKNKIDLIKNKGYNLEIVWETDYEDNPKIIEEILKKYE